MKSNSKSISRKKHQKKLVKSKSNSISGNFFFFKFQGGELGLSGKLKRSAILEKHGSCIGSMFVHKEKHAFNSMCEVENAAMNNVKNHLPSHLTQVRIIFLKVKSIRTHTYIFFKLDH